MSKTNTKKLPHPEEAPIALFDSGIGGLNVLKILQRSLPNEKFAYFADSARLPYGSCSEEEVREFSAQMVHWGLSIGAKLVLICCNTSSAILLKTWRTQYPVPILDIVTPAAKEAANFGKKLGIIATPLTIASNTYPILIKKHNPEANIVSIGCPLLVPLIEKEVVSMHSIQDILHSYLVPLLEDGVDGILYGCSHYVFLDKEIREIVGKNITIIDPAIHLIKQVTEYIKNNELEKHDVNARFITEHINSHYWVSKKNECKKQKNTVFYTTGNPASLTKKVKENLGFSPNVHYVVLD